MRTHTHATTRRHTCAARTRSYVRTCILYLCICICMYLSSNQPAKTTAMRLPARRARPRQPVAREARPRQPVCARSARALRGSGISSSEQQTTTQGINKQSAKPSKSSENFPEGAPRARRFAPDPDTGRSVATCPHCFCRLAYPPVSRVHPVPHAPDRAGVVPVHCTYTYTVHRGTALYVQPYKQCSPPLTPTRFTPEFGDTRHHQCDMPHVVMGWSWRWRPSW
jgi:hypothetical protein